MTTMESKCSSDADGAKIQPAKGPKRSVSKMPCGYEDPDHPSFWKCKYKLNPLYKGPADATKPGSQGPDRQGNTKMIRYYVNPKTYKKMPFRPNFYTWKKARRYAERSCCCLKETNNCRKTLVKFVTSPFFENLTLLAVLLSTIFIMVPNYDYKTIDHITYSPHALSEDGCCDFMQLPPGCGNKTDPDTLCVTESCAKAVTQDNMCCECPTINMIVGSVAAEWVFLGIFLVEMALKMVAFGVLPGPASWYGSYFTDGWNILDFIVVAAAIITAPGIAAPGPSLGFLRLIRALRPLRSLSFIPSMRRMVQTLLISVSQLVAVLMLLSFIFLIFGTLTIQIYAGQLRYTCRLTNFPLQLPVMSLQSPEYSSGGVGWKNVSEVNWCTFHDDWENTGMWKGMFEDCDPNNNVFANTRKSTMHQEVFYHRLEQYPAGVVKGVQRFKTQYFYFARSKEWHRMHLELMLNASRLAATSSAYRFSAQLYEADVLGSKGIFEPCHDDQNRTIPISFDQCNRICYNEIPDSNGGAGNPCQEHPDGAQCEIWENRPFDRYNENDPMCDKYCPQGSANWDIHDLLSPDAHMNSPWRNVTADSLPFYNDHKHCFWPNDNGEHGYHTANRYCAAWFRSVYDDAKGHNKCPATQYCGSDYDATGNLRFHGFDIVNTAIYKEDLLWGIPQFNNFLEAFLSIFQSITLEGWVDIMYTVTDRTNFFGASSIFVFLAFLGGVFLLNITLAVVSHTIVGERKKEEYKAKKMKIRQQNDPREMERLENLKEKPVACVQKTFLCCGTREGHKESKNCCLKNMYTLVALNWVFELFILICIIINLVVVCLDFYRAPIYLEEVLDYVNLVLAVIFFVEMVLKIIGLGLRDYFKSKWDHFDFWIVMFSVFEFGLSPPKFLKWRQVTGGVDVNFKVLRTFRVFRVFKLAKKWKHLNLVLDILGNSMADVLYFTILLSIFLLFFTVSGLQLFSNRFHFDPITNRPVPLELDEITKLPVEAYVNATVPNANFDGLYPAFVTVFKILAGENWNNVMYDAMRSTGWEAVVFFVIMFCILEMIVMEMIVVIILSHFDELSKKSGRDDSEENEGETREVERCCCCFLIGPKLEKERDALGSMSCCKSKGKKQAPAPKSPEMLVQHDILLLLAVEGPLMRWLRTCSPGMEKFLYEFYCAGVEQVSDFGIMSANVLGEMGLSNEEMAAFRKAIKQPAPKGVCMTAFEEITMLRILKLKDEKFQNEQRLEAKQNKVKEREMEIEEQVKTDHRITEHLMTINSIEHELKELEAKLTPDVKALCMCRRSKCRIAINSLVETRWFGNGILAAILLSTLLLMMETPLMMKPDHWVTQFFFVCNWIFAWIFITEMVLKIFAKGFVCHKNAYLRNYWNVLDFIIVQVSILMMILDILSMFGINPVAQSVGAVRALRALRALRPLRSIRRLPSLRLIVQALLASIPDILQTFLVVIIFFFIFSVIGVNFYRGSFMYCDFSVLPDATGAMKTLEKCAIDGLPHIDHAKCTLWTDLSSDQRVDYITGSDNEYDKIFTAEYNTAVASGEKLDWELVQACDLSHYISNSITNWTDPGPKCDGDTGTVFYDDEYYLTQSRHHYRKPTSRNICDWMGGNWDTVVPQSFDNVFIGLVSWLELSTTEGWVDAMYAAADYRGEDMEPMRVDTYRYDGDFWYRHVRATLLFVFFIFFGTFLLTNMFVGTTCRVFKQMRMQNDREAVFSTADQKEWLRQQKTIRRLRPFLEVSAPNHPTRRKIFDVVTSSGFEAAIFLCILINTLVMMARYFPTGIPPGQYVVVAEIANIGFVLIFTLEAIFKIIGLGQQYFCKKNCRSKTKGKDGVVRTSCSFAFMDGWHVFDFAIVIGGISGFIVKYVIGFSGINTVTTLIRTFRVAKIFRLVRHPYLKKLKLLISTIALSLPSICNLALLLFLFLCIFAILGVQLFATVAHHAAIDDHANFESFPMAMLTLFRATTGENWNGIMHAIATNSSDISNCSTTVPWDKDMCGFCEWDQVYTSGGDPLKCLDCKPLDGCGMPLYSGSFFLIFLFFVTYMIMNIFVAVILEAYEQSSIAEAAVVTQDDLVEFNAQWQILDPDADKNIPVEDLPTLMDALPFPMGFKEPSDEKQRVLTPECYEPTNRCVLVAPSLGSYNDEDEVDDEEKAVRRRLRFLALTKTQEVKQMQIDAMGIQSYQVDGLEQVRFHDVLSACVQRVYKNSNPVTAFRIDNQDKENDNQDGKKSKDRKKSMSGVPIETLHHMFALTIAQAKCVADEL